MPSLPSRPLADLIRENAVRLGMGAALAGTIWVWSEVNALKHSVQAQHAAIAGQQAALASVRETAESRYAALRERTDTANEELKQRINRIENQNTQIAAHLLEVMRALARVEAQITGTRPGLE